MPDTTTLALYSYPEYNLRVEGRHIQAAITNRLHGYMDKNMSNKGTRDDIK